ncbi:hypothetical protein [Aureliella helgolandensis]|uniref:Uncharacterized protein n=1 Tax=Aureliella helgolandensis TaxID=2527968 RepID=A0A518GHK0_9BACT|nr:hypothetical protein [Aureliella helgolandensis]QDV28075.1 hypothetical protein Q31a_64680 [Aureliella helgolandensis]
MKSRRKHCMSQPFSSTAIPVDILSVLIAICTLQLASLTFVYSQEKLSTEYQARVEMVLRYFANNSAFLNADCTLEMARVALKNGHSDPVLSWFHQIPQSNRDDHLRRLFNEISYRGDLQTLQKALAVFERETSELQLVKISIAALANGTHFSEAIQLIQLQPESNRSSLLIQLAITAYLSGRDEIFENISNLLGAKEKEQSALIAELKSRREKIEKIVERRETLGISRSWDELLLLYRLGPSLLLPERDLLDAALTAADTPSQKIRVWFCWGALAAVDSRVDDLNQSRRAIDAIMQGQEQTRRNWQPEVLFLATAARDIEYIKQLLKQVDLNTRCEPALIASALSLRINPELRSYLDRSECLPDRCAESFIAFLRVQSSSFNDLCTEIDLLENEVIRMQLSAKLL